MKNNKVLMSLVAASIAAMAAAPELLKSDTAKNESDKEDTKKIIDLASNTNPEHAEMVKDVENQVGAILNKKAPVMKVSESVSILVDNYGSNDISVKEKIYKDLKLAQYNNDSATPMAGSTVGTQTNTYGTNSPVVVCHSACHGACHSACHGSRGWR